MHYSTELYGRLKAETGQDTSWREVGGIRLASSAERMEEIKRLVGMALVRRGDGIDLTQRGAGTLPTHVAGRRGRRGVHPSDGIIDPTGLTNALAIGAKSREASSRTRTWRRST